MSIEGVTLDGLNNLEQLHDSALLYAVFNNKDYNITAGQLKQLLLDNLPPAQLPEGLVGEDRLTERLADYYTKEQIDQAIATALQNLPGLELPAGLVYESTFNELVARVEELEQTSVTAEQLQSAIAGIQIPQAPDLSDFVTSAGLTEALGGVVSEVLGSEAFTGVVTDLNQMVTERDLRIQALEEKPDYQLPAGLATTEEVNQALALKLSKPAEAVQNALLAFQDGQLVQVSAQLGRIFYVNRLTANPNEDGSVFAPFKTIQAALDAVPASSTIMVAPGAYAETITPVRANILIQGSGCVGAVQTEIAGQVLITGATTTRFRLKDMQVRNTDVNVSPVKIEGGQLRHYFNNLVVEVMTNTVAPAVHVTGTPSNWIAFLNCDLGGEVLLDGTPANGTTVYFNSGAHASTHINIQANYNVVAHDMVRLDGITHTAGNLNLTRVTGFGNKGLTSTADTGRMQVEFSSLRKKDGTLAPLVKTGQAPYDFDYFVYDEATQLTGN